ncbi:MAG: glycosyltransferase [Bacteroidota bacterium]
MRKKRIIISVINDLVGDQRIIRIASALQAHDFEVEVVGRKLPDSLEVGKLPYKTHRMRLIFQKGKFFYMEYNIRLFLFLLLRKVDILNSNDLDTLLANFLVSRLRGKELVYDSHEYFTEVPELMNRPGTRKVWLKLEQWLFPKLKTVYTVNTSIAKMYEEKYGVKVDVVRNLPTRKEVGGEGNKHILIYQGALNVARGIELMIDSMKYLPEYILWIVGKGDIEQELKERAAAMEGGKIEFKGFVRPDELGNLTNKAGLGLSLEEDRGLSYRYSSPNKIYDYLQASLPVLVSDLPEMAALVRSYGVGEILEKDERSSEAVAKRIRGICEGESYNSYRAKSVIAAQELNWENEQIHLINHYKKDI